MFLSSAILTINAQPTPPTAHPAALGVPVPGPTTNGPYAPQPIIPGGIVMPLYSPGSPFLKAARVHEAEKYNMREGVPGRIESIVNIHNPSIEVHVTDPGRNTGAAVILMAGGGHTTLNVGPEGADFVPFFYNYGVNTIILRNHLRVDGYDVQKDEVNDALQSIRLVRAYAAEWKIDPHKIGIMGFSAGGNWLLRPQYSTTSSTSRTAALATRWQASHRAPILYASFIPALRPFPATGSRRRFRATRHRRSW